MTPTPNADDLAEAFRTALLAMLPAGVEVIQGQQNRAASPSAADYVVFWPGSRQRLATNLVTWDEQGLAPTVVDLAASTRVMVQTDVHGPNSADNAQVIMTVLRSGYGVSLFPAGITPLHADDPTQAPFMTGEDQYEERWVVMAQIQLVPVVSTPAEFADSLAVTIEPPADTGA